MHSVLKKVILYTLGAYNLSRENLEKLIAELEEDGAFDQEEGRKLVDEAIQMAAARSSKLKTRVSAEVTRILDDAGMTAVKRKEVEEKVTNAVMGQLSKDEKEE